MAVFSTSDLTMDHVIPKSRGEIKLDKHCRLLQEVQQQERRQTPQEAECPSLKNRLPRWSINILLRGFYLPSEWKDFI